MKIPLQVYAFLVGSLVFYSAGEYYSKIYSLSPNWRLFFLALLMYVLNSALWLPALTAGKSLTIVSTIWNLSYMMTAPIIGLMIFNESVTLWQGVGICMGFLSMLLMSL